ncbi:uncharacterized protein LOC134181623 [Corticium candelabrum]|uniref:uncharacterized protein LOC134181623 n=1 Tax=Corticium candelabrum TaxID=121492 RepID=UPI002E26AFEC|nr:uncharacterized protein LOC134181623 [Corticium candelabrum]
MYRATVVVLLLVSISVQAEDSAGSELDRLNSDIGNEFETVRKIEEDRKHAETESDDDDDDDAHTDDVQRLNSTERDMLEKAIRNLTEELEMLEDQINTTRPRNSRSAEQSETENLEKRKLEIRLGLNVLTAIKIVDDEIVNKELGLTAETRRKRSLERKSLLAAIDEELETGSKVLGIKKDTEVPQHSRTKRATLQQLAKQTCSLSRDFVTSRYKKAKRLGKTIQVSKGGKIGVFLTASANIAHTYGPQGEFGCTATSCTGWSTNIGVSVTTTEGYYENFDDVDGKSLIKMWSVSILLRTWTYGSIYEQPGGKKIGYLTRTSRGLMLLPVSYAEMKCISMVKPPCSPVTMSYTEKYYVSCGWSRCARYRKSYRYEYPC